MKSTFPIKKHTKESRAAARARHRRFLASQIATACDAVVRAQKAVEVAQDKVTELKWRAHQARMTLRRYDDLTAKSEGMT